MTQKVYPAKADPRKFNTQIGELKEAWCQQGGDELRFLG